LNVGGIANFTIVPPGTSRSGVRAWDCGPGNMLLDAFVRERTNGREAYDEDGKYARAGRVKVRCLEVLLGDAYFARTPPKSTGREHVGASFLAEHRGMLDAFSLEDGCATLLALTTESIARDILAHASADARVVVSGGGARNTTLLERLRERLGARVVTADALGIDGDRKEATAFAILGYETLRGARAALPEVTGARRPALLGSIAPFELGALLKKMEGEMVKA